jgi:hypothetical protein
MSKDFQINNRDNDNHIFSKSEVDYVIEMMRNRYRDFKKSEMMKPFFMKGLTTLKALANSLSLPLIYERIKANYHEVWFCK